MCEEAEIHKTVREGEKRMSLEAIRQVTEKERANREKKNEIEVQARQLVADAERSGLALLQQVRSEAAEKGKQLLREAEQRAEAQAEEIRKTAEAEKDAQRREAEKHLEEAADFIVERVVKN